MQDLEILYDFVNRLHPLKTKNGTIFLRYGQPSAYKRKTVLTAAGETERHLYFVLEGVQRAFYLGSNHPEATVVFTYPHSFSGVADSFLTQLPSKYFLETITSSKMFRTSYHAGTTVDG